MRWVPGKKIKKVMKNKRLKFAEKVTKQEEKGLQECCVNRFIFQLVEREEKDESKDKCWSTKRVVQTIFL